MLELIIVNTLVGIIGSAYVIKYLVIMFKSEGVIVHYRLKRVSLVVLICLLMLLNIAIPLGTLNLCHFVILITWLCVYCYHYIKA